ncbi:hypothetical protein ACUS59_23685, partial [Pseudomonas aeruginosa]
WGWLLGGGGGAGEHPFFFWGPGGGGVTSLPMADKAVFAVNYGVAGLLAEPMNLAAEEALRDWR